MLVQAKPGEFFVVGFAVGLAGKVAILGAPVGNGAGDAVNYLSDTGFTFGRVGLAVEVLADDNVGLQRAPVLRDLAVLLLKQNPTILVLDVCGPRFPLDRRERVNALGAEMRLDFHRAGLRNDRATVPILGLEIILEESLAAVHRALSLFKLHEIDELILSSFSPVVGLSVLSFLPLPV